MSKFKDTEGREWSIRIDVNAVKRVKEDCAVELLDIAKGDANAIAVVLANPAILINVLFSVCKPQAEKLGITGEEFASGVVGDVIETATTALIEGIADFFPASRRKVLRAALAKVMEADAMAVQNAATAIASLDVQSLLQKSGGPSTSSPGASE